MKTYMWVYRNHSTQSANFLYASERCAWYRKRSIMSTLTNARPLTWPAVLVSPVCEFCPAASVTMEADLPEMTGRFDPDILEAQ